MFQCLLLDTSKTIAKWRLADPWRGAMTVGQTSASNEPPWASVQVTPRVAAPSEQVDQVPVCQSATLQGVVKHAFSTAGAGTLRQRVAYASPPSATAWPSTMQVALLVAVPLPQVAEQRLQGPVSQ